MALKNTGYFQCSARNWGSEIRVRDRRRRVDDLDRETWAAEPSACACHSVRPFPGSLCLLDSKVMSNATKVSARSGPRLRLRGAGGDSVIGPAIEHGQWGGTRGRASSARIFRRRPR